MILQSVTHDVSTNTLEVVFVEHILDTAGVVVEIKRVSCTNYSAPQKLDFETAVGVDAAKYVFMAGW